MGLLIGNIGRWLFFEGICWLLGRWSIGRVAVGGGRWHWGIPNLLVRIDDSTPKELAIPESPAHSLMDHVVL